MGRRAGFCGGCIGENVRIMQIRRNEETRRRP